MRSTTWSFFPRTLDTSTRFEEIFDAAFYPTHRNPSLLHKFEYFKRVCDHIEDYDHNQRDLRKEFSGEGAWNHGNDIDPKLENNAEFPTHGKVCDTMKYVGFNIIFINKMDQVSRMDHPSSGSHYIFEWLGYPCGYRAIVESDRHLDDEVVALRGLDRARTTLLTPFTPDNGVTYITRTMEVGEASTAYDSWIPEQEGRLQHHSTFNLNAAPSRDHPLVVLYASAKEHFHQFLVAALKVSDCCHKEPTLLTIIVTLMHCGWHTADFHKGVCAAGIVLGNSAISGFPLQAALGALLLSADEVEDMIASSDDGCLPKDSGEARKPWERTSMHFNCIPCYSPTSVNLSWFKLCRHFAQFKVVFGSAS